jgi:hypothetical protein
VNVNTASGPTGVPMALLERDQATEAEANKTDI